MSPSLPTKLRALAESMHWMGYPERHALLWEAANALEGAEAQSDLLKTALIGLKRGDCWCEVGIGNPMLRGKHLQPCLFAQTILEADVQP